MNAKRFANLLVKLEACEDAREWARGKTLAQAWRECVRADWMCWLLVRMAGKRVHADGCRVNEAISRAEAALKGDIPDGSS